MTSPSTRRHFLFIDDEQRVLHALRRGLQHTPRSWDMTFVASAAEALRQLDTREADAVISDIQMPGADGGWLLAQVRRRFPFAGRVVLSGQPAAEELLREQGLAQYFFGKPCDVRELSTTLQRICTLRDLLADRCVQSAVKRLGVRGGRRPPLGRTAAAVSLAGAPLRPATVPLPVAGLLKGASRVLQTVIDAPAALLNAGVPGEASDAACGNFPACMPPVAIANRVASRAWKVAAIVRAILVAEHANEDDQRTGVAAALLRDVGIALIAAGMPQQWRATVRTARVRSLPLWRAETAVYGTSHAEVGAWFLRHWNLTGPVIEAVAYHHRPGTAPGPARRPVAALHIADMLTDAPGATLSDANRGYLRDAGLPALIGDYAQLPSVRAVLERGDAAQDPRG